MENLIKFEDLLNKKIEKTETKIDNIRLECELLIKQRIDLICESIVDREEDMMNIIFSDLLKDLREAIDDWFTLQNREDQLNDRNNS